MDWRAGAKSEEDQRPHQFLMKELDSGGWRSRLLPPSVLSRGPEENLWGLYVSWRMRTNLPVEITWWLCVKAPNKQKWFNCGFVKQTRGLSWPWAKFTLEFKNKSAESDAPAFLSGSAVSTQLQGQWVTAGRRQLVITPAWDYALRCRSDKEQKLNPEALHLHRKTWEKYTHSSQWP